MLDPDPNEPMEDLCLICIVGRLLLEPAEQEGEAAERAAPSRQEAARTRQVGSLYSLLACSGFVCTLVTRLRDMRFIKCSVEICKETKKDLSRAHMLMFRIAFTSCPNGSFLECWLPTGKPALSTPGRDMSAMAPL